MFNRPGSASWPRGKAAPPPPILRAIMPLGWLPFEPLAMHHALPFPFYLKCSNHHTTLQPACKKTNQRNPSLFKDSYLRCILMSGLVRFGAGASGYSIYVFQAGSEGLLKSEVSSAGLEGPADEASRTSGNVFGKRGRFVVERFAFHPSSPLRQDGTRRNTGTEAQSAGANPSFLA